MHDNGPSDQPTVIFAPVSPAEVLKYPFWKVRRTTIHQQMTLHCQLLLTIQKRRTTLSLITNP
jgi:hypothetical protein